jgi:hypothetical protein
MPGWLNVEAGEVAALERISKFLFERPVAISAAAVVWRLREREMYRHLNSATDARFHVPRIGRIKIACGLDAVDGAFSTIFGGASLTEFQVWAYQIERNTVGVGDVLDFTRRLDNCISVHREEPYIVNG